MKQAARQRYMLDVAERIDRVLAVTGEVPGALAKLFCYNFVGMARRIGASRSDATKLLHETWERFEKAEGPREDVSAIIKTERTS